MSTKPSPDSRRPRFPPWSGGLRPAAAGTAVRRDPPQRSRCAGPSAVASGAHRRPPRSSRAGVPGLGLAALGLAAALSAGCGHSPDTKFFTLAAVRPDNGPQVTASAPVTVRSVHVAAFLDRPELVRRERPERLKVETFQQWGAPLGDMARRVLTEDLAARLPPGTVLPPGAHTPPGTREITVDVSQFEPGPEGETLLAGSWTLSRGDGSSGIGAPAGSGSDRSGSDHDGSDHDGSHGNGSQGKAPAVRRSDGSESEGPGPADTSPGEASPGEASPGETSPGEASPGETSAWDKGAGDKVHDFRLDTPSGSGGDAQATAMSQLLGRLADDIVANLGAAAP